MVTIVGERKDRRFAAYVLPCRIARSAVEKSFPVDHRDKSDCRGGFRQRSHRSRPKEERACAVLAVHPSGGAASRESRSSIVPGPYPTTCRQTGVRTLSLRIPALERLVRWCTNADRRKNDLSTFRSRDRVGRLCFPIIWYGCALGPVLSKYIASWMSRNAAALPSPCDALTMRKGNAVRFQCGGSMMRAIEQRLPRNQDAELRI